jgi:hypothetical protein
MPSAAARSRSAACSASVRRRVIAILAWYQFDTAPNCRYALPPALNVERPLISIRVVGDEVVAADT